MTPSLQSPVSIPQSPVSDLKSPAPSLHSHPQLSQSLGCAILPGMARELRKTPNNYVNKPTIAVYLIERHPLEPISGKDPFRWLPGDDGFLHELRGIIGPFNPANLSIMKDAGPSGPAWSQLLESLVNGDIGIVVTHLAPLSSGQRQQLIGVCAFSGASLITPGDGGRNYFREHPPSF